MAAIVTDLYCYDIELGSNQWVILQSKAQRNN